MPNDPELTYVITWRTCRNKPLVRNDTRKLLFRLLTNIAAQNELKLEDKWVMDGGRLVGVRVTTKNVELSPNSIAYMLRHKTGGEIRRSNPEFQKLPAVWTSEYEVSTVGRFDD